MEPLKEQDWKKISKALNAGRCILVLGPDIAIAPDDPAGGSLSEQLAQSIAAQPNIPQDTVDNAELYSIAQRYLDYGGRRWELEDLATNFYAGFDGQTTDLHRLLAGLPFRFYLSVTHDHFMGTALEEQKNRDASCHYYSFRKSNTTDIEEPDTAHPLLYQLYGSVDNPESLVLTESDLLQFLQTIVTGAPPLPPLVESLLKHESNAFLFLGFGFSQWYVRLLLHTLLGPDRPLHKTHLRPSLVFEDSKFYQHPDSGRTVAYFENQQAFVFRQYQPHDFAQQLAEKCDEIRIQQSREEVTPPADAPLVFLSYRSCDREKVDNVRARLNQEKIQTWQDVHNLRGGDRWEQAINKVIGEQVDYFVVLQTPALVNSAYSVVFDEIREAQKRDKRRNPDDISSFIVPAILEPCEGLQTLRSSIHMVDVTQDDGITRLAHNIKEDWQRRRHD